MVVVSTSARPSRYAAILRGSFAGVAVLIAAAVASAAAGGLPVTYATPAAPGEADLLAQVAVSTVTVTAVAADGATTLGSGFFVTADGRLLTSAHVVAGAAALTVARPDGSRLQASRVAVDPALDVAELAVAGPSRPLTLAPSTPGDGAAVYVLGNPGGESPSSAARGRVTALHRRATAAGRVYPDLLATDASSVAGTSGGAVIDAYGRVVGLVALGEPRSLNTLAIPVDRFRPALASWAAVSPAAFVQSRPVGSVGTWTGSCDVARCSGTATITNRGAAGSLTAGFQFWVGPRLVAGCTDARTLATGETATFACAAAVDLRSQAGETYTVSAPVVTAA